MDSILESSVHEDGNSFSMHVCCHMKRGARPISMYLSKPVVTYRTYTWKLPSTKIHLISIIEATARHHFPFFTGFYFSSMLIAQLLYAMVVKQIVRSYSECNKHYETPMFPTYHGQPNWQYRSNQALPRPPKGIQRILIKFSIEWDNYQGQKRVRRQKKNATHMKQNVPTSLKRTIRSQNTWSMSIQDHHDVFNGMLHRFGPLKVRNKREMKS